MQSPASIMWKKIVCAVDFSEGAREAFRVAVKLAVAEHAELVIAHVWTPPVYVVGEALGLPGPMLTELILEAEKQLADLKTEAERLEVQRVSTVLATGIAWHQIVQLAKEDRAVDLLVAGTHGRTGFKHALIGSVAEKIVRHAPCPVLVIPPRA